MTSDVDSSSTAKRALTEHARARNVAMDTFASVESCSTPSDVKAKLANMGRRVRQSVYEGYVTNRHPPLSASTQSLRTKSLSTGNVYRFANDTLNDILSDASPAQPLGSLPVSARKRSRSVSEQNSSEQETGAPMQCDEDLSPSAIVRVVDPSRPVKPLRRQPRTSGRALGATQSLPIILGGGNAKEWGHQSAPIVEEDWSQLASPSSQLLPAFDPMVL